MPMSRFTDTVSVVTGGVSGIGAAITRRLVAEGGRVVVADINKEAIASTAETFGENVVGRYADMTDEASVAAVVAEAVDRFGQLDAFFNVAGGARPGRLVDMSLDHWRFNIALNLDSAFLGTKYAAARFLEQGGGGVIINVASLNSLMPMHQGAGYSTAKAGVVMLTKQAALELGGHGIRVNAVSPGLVATPLTKQLTDVPAIEAAYLERIPAGRLAAPEEIAAACLFLASSDASYVNGENLVVDGAWATTGYPDLRPFLG
ncbi:hypothetical protein W97_01054 [Coniosporium apollinis CBS 100218]|uniref:SDR family oxidoreductase n=1 Tax=Coniosporium apollinis (strain CBS 100218) TaxID=1168221 RepID=R7YJK9_CONA1|nr:uncharacterized protein W97_01054 [Coniosporium apollinis CBS 100218]EON61836.1 hypothetical protein W97_01054 [Coniosporium apollinis CBS 100218]